jgi:hypothetical protein
MNTTYMIDLGCLGEHQFSVDYTCYQATPDTRWEPGEPAYCEIEQVNAVEPEFAIFNSMVNDYLNDKGNADFAESVWPDEEADKADYYYQLYKDRKIDDSI